MSVHQWLTKSVLAMLFAVVVVPAFVADAPLQAETPVAAAEEAADSDEEAEAAADAEGEEDAAEHGHGDSPAILSWDPGSAIWNLIIFLIVFAILAKFVWPNVLNGLQAREDKIREDLESAEQANVKAQSILDEYQTKLDEAQAQAQSVLATARQDAEASAQRILDDAKKDAESQRERALADIDNAKKVAVAEIAQQTSDLAMSVAQSVVGRELKADDHADLIRQSLDRLPSKN